VRSLLAGAASALAVAALAPAPAAAAGDGRPVPATGHDVTRPWVTKQVADQMAAARVAPPGPRGAVSAPTARAAAAPARREVFGYASAERLGDPAAGFRSWDLSLLTTVAYFGLTVNASDGSLVQTDTGWSVWHSSTASDFVNAAHASGVRVLLTLIFQDTSGAMCHALGNGSTTIGQASAQLMGADGIDIDYEGVNQTCADGVSLRTKLAQFVQQVRAAQLGTLVVNTYAGSAEDPGGFFDIPTLAGSTDAFFVMAYGLETANGPCATCMDPTSPLQGSAPNYIWNVTRAAGDYTPWAAQTIIGFPYYGVAGCVQGPNPPPNAPLLATGGSYSAGPYTDFAGLASDPAVSSLSLHRDGLDPNGQERWASYDVNNAQLHCTREAYWDDPVSLGHKYDVVNQGNFRGAGIFALDFGGGSPELWSVLAAKFGGQLRVTTNPALPSQILVDGAPHDSWGLTWLNLPPGAHTVSFTHVEGFTEPAAQQVTVTGGQTTVVQGDFTQRGELRVLTNPAVPGAISVDGTTRDDWGVFTDLPTGSHQVCFGPVAGFTPPACQTATLTAGQQTTVTGNYISDAQAPGPQGTGQLRVTTNPALPSQILVNGVPMDSWGLTWVDLAPGTYTVSFTHVEGWTEPSPQQVTVTGGQITVLQGSFVQRGELHVVTSPAVPATISMDGLARNSWGVFTDVPVGSHVICFGWAPSMVAPPCQTVTVTAGSLSSVTGAYSAVS
jgi:Glycosyl hydrolases family 18